MATTTLDPRASTSPGAAAIESPAIDASMFERVYQDAGRHVDRIPWAMGEAHPALVAWLNSEGTCHVRPGCRVAIAGCGLGDDAIEFLNRGFDIVAFDAAPSAIDWARRRHPHHADCFVCADACDAPARWRHRFDLVVDVNNLPWIEESRREDYLGGVVDLLHPNGAMLLICAGADHHGPVSNQDGFNPLTTQETLRLMRGFGLSPARDLDNFTDDHDPSQRWLRGCFRFNH